MFGRSKKREKTPKPPREYKHPISRSMHGQNLRVNFKMVDEDHYETSEYWTGLNGASLMAMGYLPAEDYKRQFKDVFTRVYVKFEGFEMRPWVRVGEDGQEYDVEVKETSSTLYDYFVSTAEQEFMEGMKVKRLSAMSTNQLVLWGVVIAGVVIAGWFFAHGGF